MKRQSLSPKEIGTEKTPEYEMGLMFETLPDPEPANLLDYPSFFEMGETARQKLDI